MRIWRAGALLAGVLASGSVALGASSQDPYPSDLGAVWSPVGPQIAFTRYERRDQSSIYVVRSDGRRLRRLYRPTGEALGLVWSPDGRSLAFTEIPASDRSVATIRVLDVRSRKLTRPVEGSSPAWSPDGRRIVFVRGWPPRGLSVLNPRSGRVWRIPITHSFSYPGSPTWSPDGRRLAITTGGNRVSVLSAKGGRARLLGLGRAPSWSPDGKTVVVACLYSSRVAFFSPTTSNAGCYDGAIHAQAHAPRWAPDGSRVAFSHCWDPGGVCGISIQARDSSRPTSLTGPGVYPSWSPDGRRLVFSSAREGARLYLVNSDGSRVRPLF